jgi:hypothetical protein
MMQMIQIMMCSHSICTYIGLYFIMKMVKEDPELVKQRAFPSKLQCLAISISCTSFSAYKMYADGAP